MNSKALAGLVMGACLLGGAVGAEAATVSAGTITGSWSHSFNPAYGNFSDTVTFNLSPLPANLATSGQQTKLVMQIAASTSITIFDGYFNHVKLESPTATYIDNTFTPVVTTYNYSLTTLPVGDYTLSIAGAATSQVGGGLYTATLFASPVPLPAALPLFGSALAFASIFSVVRRRPRA